MSFINTTTATSEARAIPGTVTTDDKSLSGSSIDKWEIQVGRVVEMMKTKVAECENGAGEEKNGAEEPDDQNTAPTKSKDLCNTAVDPTTDDISLSSTPDGHKKPSSLAPISNHCDSTTATVDPMAEDISLYATPGDAEEASLPAPVSNKDLSASAPELPALKETPRKVYSSTGLFIHHIAKPTKEQCSCVDSSLCSCCGIPAELGFCFCHKSGTCHRCGKEFKTEEERRECEDSEICGHCGERDDCCHCSRVGEICPYCREIFWGKGKDVRCACCEWRICNLCGGVYKGRSCWCRDEDVCVICGDPKSRRFPELEFCGVCGEVVEDEVCGCPLRVYCEICGEVVQGEMCGCRWGGNCTNWFMA